jgi:hypothetical protein
MLALNLPPTIRLQGPADTIRWTDEPVTQSTPIKAVHVNELRQAVDMQRELAGLPAFAWTDDPVVAGVTVVRAVHFLELQWAIQDLWTVTALGTLPEWSSGCAPTPGCVIFASNVNDLRTAMTLVHRKHSEPPECLLVLME